MPQTPRSSQQKLLTKQGRFAFNRLAYIFRQLEIRKAPTTAWQSVHPPSVSGVRKAPQVQLVVIRERDFTWTLDSSWQGKQSKTRLLVDWRSADIRLPLTGMSEEQLIYTCNAAVEDHSRWIQQCHRDFPGQRPRQCVHLSLSSWDGSIIPLT